MNKLAREAALDVEQVAAEVVVNGEPRVNGQELMGCGGGGREVVGCQGVARSVERAGIVERGLDTGQGGLGARVRRIEVADAGGEHLGERGGGGG